MTDTKTIERERKGVWTVHKGNTLVGHVRDDWNGYHARTWEQRWDATPREQGPFTHKEDAARWLVER